MLAPGWDPGTLLRVRVRAPVHTRALSHWDTGVLRHVCAHLPVNTLAFLQGGLRKAAQERVTVGCISHTLLITKLLTRSAQIQGEGNRENFP